MKLTTPSQNIQTGNVKDGNEFKIKATGKAFRILSNGLYSDKILAVVRELACNCIDAHKMNGNVDEPFWMHLPNRLEPYFAVRDFGIGLDHDGIMHLYTTYFESTKQESNEFIGALGLGSKSPFSYVDSFNVTSHFNGTKRMYTAYLGDDGTPSINLMTEEETDEANGLYIQIAVKNYDFDVFESRTRRALHYFPVKPTVVGCADFAFDELDHVISGDGWGVRDTTLNENDGGSAKALQGNVAYPLEKDKLRDADKVVNALLSLPIDIVFPIGELDVQASREGLSYDKPTQENIIARAKIVHEAIINQLQENFTECKSQWEAYQLYHKLFNADSGIMGQTFRDMAQRGELTIEWNGITINSSIHYIPVSEMPHNLGVYARDRFQEVILKAYYKKEKNRTHTPSKCREYSHYSGTHNGVDCYFIRADSKPHIFVNDVGTGAIARAKRVMINQNEDRFYMIDVTDTTKENREVANELLREAMDKLSLTEDDITYISATPGPNKRPKSSRAGSTGPRVKSTGVFHYTGSHTQNSYYSNGYSSRPLPLSYSWDMLEQEDIEDEFEQGGIYVEMKAWKPVGTPGQENHSGTGFWYFLNMINDSKMLDTTDLTIVGVRSAKVKRYKEAKNWVNIFDYIHNEVKKLARKNIARDIALADQKHNAISRINSTIPTDSKSITQMRRQATGTNFSAFLGKIKDLMKVDASHLKSFVNILVTYDLYDTTQTEKAAEVVQTFKDEWKEILNQYPLMRLMSSHNVQGDTMKDMTQYINLVEKENKAKAA